MSYKDGRTRYVVLADRSGDELANGCYPPSRDGSAPRAFWKQE
jgi:hypothetical protein